MNATPSWKRSRVGDALLSLLLVAQCCDVLEPTRVRRAPVGALLTAEHIDPVLAEARPGIAACRTRFGASEADPLSLELTVLGATGRVIGSKPLGANASSPLGRCVADVLFELLFPAFTDPSGEQTIVADF